MDVKEFLDKLGQELIETSCTELTERAFLCLGGNLKEFLETLDGVHDVLLHKQQTLDQDQEAAFICTSIDDNLELDFVTERPALAYLLVGSLKAIARILYNTDANIKVEENSSDSRCFR